MKVNFLIGGTQKGGTTALDLYLRNHPEICMASRSDQLSMARRKEAHFFDDEERFQHKKVDYAAYHQFFQPREHQTIFGESTPIYMYWYYAPRRIWEYNPNMKWILLLRNPIERAYSHWNMERDRCWDKIDFGDAIQNEPVRCREVLPLQHQIYSYVDRGFYTEQLRRVWFFFPKEQTFVIKSEELWANPAPVLNNICRFLGVEPVSRVDLVKVHSQKYVSPMGASEKRYLLRVFEYEIKQLERLLGWECADWLE